MYSKYLPRKLSLYLKANIPGTWVRENLDSICHKRLRSLLEIPTNKLLDAVQLPKSKLGLNIIDISTKYLQSQITICKKLPTSKNNNIKFTYKYTKYRSKILLIANLSLNQTLLTLLLCVRQTWMSQLVLTIWL